MKMTLLRSLKTILPDSFLYTKRYVKKASLVITLAIALSGCFGYVLYDQGAEPKNILGIAMVLVMYFIATVAIKIMYYFRRYPTTEFVSNNEHTDVFDSVYNPANVAVRQNYIMHAYYDSMVHFYLIVNTVAFYLMFYHQSLPYGILLFVSILFGSLYVICGQVACGYSSHLEKRNEKVPS